MATDQDKHPELPPLRPVRVSETEIRRRSRRGFISGALAIAGGYGAWRWLRSRGEIDGLPWPVRNVLNFNGRFSRALFSNRRGEEHPAGAAPPEPRINGDLGLESDLDPDAWRLSVSGLAGGDGTARLTLHDLQALPKVQTTMRLCCIEGWSRLVNWGGARFADFAAKYPAKPFDYVAMSTPDGEYFVGLDAPSALHPQTLLCYEIDGQPLTLEHGAPLRLVIPSKYGIKNIKRIGQITFTHQRPRDYWAENGYDWYAGL